MLFSTSALVALFLLPLAAFAAPARSATTDPSLAIDRRGTTILPYNVDAPGATPAYIIPIASLLPVTSVVTLVNATSGFASTSELFIAVETYLNSLLTVTAPGLLTGIANAVTPLLCGFCGNCPVAPVVATKPATTSVLCLDGTNANDTVINSLLSYGGNGTIVYLCPGAVILLTNPIIYTAPNQVITTLGLPLSITRATLRVTGAQQSCAVFGSCVACTGIKLTNVIVDGNRPNLGWLSTGQALIEMGGASNQVVNGISSFGPRGWSALHMIEGTGNSCSGSSVTNSQFGPSGHAPSGAAQFRLLKHRRDTGTYPPGEWADGISMACKGSTVTGNTITDATDGAIVIFGAPETLVQDNTITANTRQLLGGINAVDFAPFYGEFTGTLVSRNTLNAAGAMIKVGLAIGTLTWADYNSTSYYNYDGVWDSNTLISSSNTGYFGYGISVAGHRNAQVTNNLFFGANFGGTGGAPCEQALPFSPAVYNPYTTPSGNFQSTLVNGGAFCFLICNGPGPITRASVTE